MAYQLTAGVVGRGTSHYEIAVTSCSSLITVFELFEGFHLFHLHPFGFLCVFIILGFKGLKANPLFE